MQNKSLNSLNKSVKQIDTKIVKFIKNTTAVLYYL